jgi:hypothetical protein
MQNFILKAKEVHNDKYIYSKVNYINTVKNVTIICSKHGEFSQKVKIHLKGHGCPKCGKETQRLKILSTTSKFIKKAEQIHENKYDYTIVDYKNNIDKVKIKCQYHGIFEQSPKNTF